MAKLPRKASAVAGKQRSLRRAEPLGFMRAEPSAASRSGRGSSAALAPGRPHPGRGGSAPCGRAAGRGGPG